MLPRRQLNIYPKTDENIQSIIDFYFVEFNINQKSGVEIFKEYSFLSLNQIEFIVRKLSEAYIPIFRKHFNPPMDFENLFKYGVDALVNEQISKSGSKNRQAITLEFKEFANKSENSI